MSSIGHSPASPGATHCLNARPPEFPAQVVHRGIYNAVVGFGFGFGESVMNQGITGKN